MSPLQEKIRSLIFTGDFRSLSVFVSVSTAGEKYIFAKSKKHRENACEHVFDMLTCVLLDSIDARKNSILNRMKQAILQNDEKELANAIVSEWRNYFSQHGSNPDGTDFGAVSSFYSSAKYIPDFWEMIDAEDEEMENDCEIVQVNLFGINVNAVDEQKKAIQKHNEYRRCKFKKNGKKEEKHQFSLFAAA